LVATARSLGVKIILVERDGEDSQHVDLCAGPLRNAVALARERPGLLEL
jgi:hypothetical protein